MLRRIKTHHCKVYTLVVLEGIEQLYKPFALCSSQYIPLSQDMPDLIQLEQQLLTHYLQGTNFARILLRREEYLPIAALPDLGENLKVTMLESCASLA